MLLTFLRRRFTSCWTRSCWLRVLFSFLIMLFCSVLSFAFWIRIRFFIRALFLRSWRFLSSCIDFVLKGEIGRGVFYIGFYFFLVMFYVARSENGFFVFRVFYFCREREGS